MRIVLDAMGSDTCPDPEVQASLEAAQLFGDEILLVGPEDQLKPKLDKASQGQASSTSKVKIIHAPDVISMEDKGLKMA